MAIRWRINVWKWKTDVTFDRDITVMMFRGQWIVSASIAVILSNMVCGELMKKLETLVLACELESFNNMFIYSCFYLTSLLPLFSFRLQFITQNIHSLPQSISSVLCSESWFSCMEKAVQCASVFLNSSNSEENQSYVAMQTLSRYRIKETLRDREREHREDKCKHISSSDPQALTEK